jgi:hypothetical protein
MFNIHWTNVLASGDPETIWNAIYSLVRDRNPRPVPRPSGGEFESPQPLDEVIADIAQEIFLRLISTDRFSYFVANNYSDQQIQHEIVLRELPAVLIHRMGKISIQSPQDQRESAYVSPASRDESSFLMVSPTQVA